MTIFVFSRRKNWKSDEQFKKKVTGKPCFLPNYEEAASLVAISRTEGGKNEEKNREHDAMSTF